MKRNVFTSQKGFSLVELMVVVAIIGILAAMSVGQVQKQIAKARQSEAKTNLSSLFTAESAFQSEYNSYVTDFLAMKLGYTGTLRYHVGFGTAFATTAAYTGAVNAAAINTSVQGAVTCPGCVFTAGATAPVAANTATAATFTAQASGQVYNGQADIWQITNTKALTNPTDGIQ